MQCQRQPACQSPQPQRTTYEQTMSAHFPNISRIAYEGPKSKNPLAFKHYNPDELIEGKRMADHLRFSIVYWHTMCGQGADMFGGPTAIRPWEAGLSGLDLAKARVPVFFEIAEKLGMPSTRSMIATWPRTAR